MAYDQSQGKMIPSPKARRERLSAEMDAAEKGKAEAVKKGNEDWRKQALYEIAFEGPGKMARTVEGSMYQSETPSGGFVSARSGSKNGVDVAKNMQDSLDRDANKEARLADMRAKGRDIRDRLVTDRLTAAGYDWKSANSADLYKDGKLDFDKTKRAADLASGRRARDTFAAWDEGDRMLAMGIERQKLSRREISSINKQLRSDGYRGQYMDPADRDALIARLSGLREEVEKTGDRQLRDYGRDWEAVNVANINQLKEREKAQKTQGQAARTQAEAYNRPMTEEEFFNVQNFNEAQRGESRSFRAWARSKSGPLTDDELAEAGYPSRSDEKGWSDRIKNNPSLRSIYEEYIRPGKKVSRTGRIMARALAAFA